MTNEPGETAPPTPASPAGSPQELSIRLHPSGPTVGVRPDQTIWSALDAAGVIWPVSCRNGSCRTCIGQLLAGAVRYTVPWPGLLPEEKASGHVLPCVACPVTPVVLAPASD